MSQHHGTPSIERCCDVAVVGGSAAGLAAALQLARQRRAVIVIDAGDPRNAPAAHMHSYLGHEGLPPAQFTAIGRDEVRRYGVEVLAGRAVDVTRDDNGAFRVRLVGGHTVIARRVLAASGLLDELPDIEGVAEHWGGDVIHCPFCHGYEVRDRRIVQIVTHPGGLHPSPLLRQLTDRLTVVLHGDVEPGHPALAPMRAARVEVRQEPVRRLVTGDDGRLTAVELVGGDRIDADAVVVGPGFRPRTEPFATLGLEVVDHPNGLGRVVETDALGETSVPGLYAAGNITDPSHQVLQAAAHGSRVGAMISFSLANEDLAAASAAAERRTATEADWDRRYGDDHLWSGNPNGTLVNEVTGRPAGRALDVGAGEGGDARWLAEQGWDVTANDISRRALDRVAAVADEHDLKIRCLHADANTAAPFGSDVFDLVSAQYASIPRTPDQRAVRNLLTAVAPGGTLLVVSHDLDPMRAPIDTREQSRAFDPDAYVRVEDFVAAVAASPEWEIEVHEKRPRPPGAASASHHVEDVVLRARRLEL